MINDLDIPSYNLKIFGNGLNLTGSTVKGKGCDIKCDKKELLKSKMAEDLEF